MNYIDRQCRKQSLKNTAIADITNIKSFLEWNIENMMNNMLNTDRVIIISAKYFILHGYYNDYMKYLASIMKHGNIEIIRACSVPITIDAL